MDNENYNVEFKWGLRAAIDFDFLAPKTIMNHFENSYELAKKGCLTKHLYGISESYFPIQFDCSTGVGC